MAQGVRGGGIGRYLCKEYHTGNTKVGTITGLQCKPSLAVVGPVQ